MLDRVFRLIFYEKINKNCNVYRRGGTTMIKRIFIISIKLFLVAKEKNVNEKLVGIYPIF